MPLPNDAAALLSRLIDEAAPRRLLALGEETRPLLARHAARLPNGERQWLADAAGLAAVGRFDFAVAAGVLEGLERRAGEQWLARLRDLHAVRFALLLPGETPAAVWPTNALLAFGLTRLAAGGGWRLFGYDLAGYKTTPEWLNAQGWANPEMWDKAWW
jgi:hypothetical protein